MVSAPVKNLGEAHEQTVGEGIHIRHHPAHQVSLGMGVQIAQGQVLNVPEGLLAQILCYPVGHMVIQHIHDPLGKARRSGADGYFQEIFSHFR